MHLTLNIIGRICDCRNFERIIIRLQVAVFIQTGVLLSFIFSIWCHILFFTRNSRENWNVRKFLRTFILIIIRTYLPYTVSLMQPLPNLRASLNFLPRRCQAKILLNINNYIRLIRNIHVIIDSIMLWFINKVRPTEANEYWAFNLVDKISDLRFIFIRHW